MRPILALPVALICLAVLAAGCAGSQPPGPPSPDNVLAQLRASRLPIKDDVIFTEETEPNHLIGRPYQYIGKAVWRDDRIELPGDPGTNTGGTVEIFANEADRQARQDYVTAVAKQPLFAEYSFANGRVLVRVSKQLSPAQAAEYERATAALKGT